MERSDATIYEEAYINYKFLNVNDQGKVYNDFLDVVSKARTTGISLY